MNEAVFALQFCFFGSHLALVDPSHFHVSFRVSSPICTEKPAKILLGMTLHLQINQERVSILTVQGHSFLCIRTWQVSFNFFAFGAGKMSLDYLLMCIAPNEKTKTKQLPPWSAQAAVTVCHKPDGL